MCWKFKLKRREFIPVQWIQSQVLWTQSKVLWIHSHFWFRAYLLRQSFNSPPASKCTMIHLQLILTQASFYLSPLSLSLSLSLALALSLPPSLSFSLSDLTTKARPFSFSYLPCPWTLVMCLLPTLMQGAQYPARRNRRDRCSAWRRRRICARNTQGSCKYTKYFALFSKIIFWCARNTQGSCKWTPVEFVYAYINTYVLGALSHEANFQQDV